MTPVRRSVRLILITDALKGRRGGLTPADLARMTETSVRSIQRDLKTLQEESGLALERRQGRYALVREERLGPLELTLHEARAMLIAIRLYLRYSDETEPFGVTALNKLAAIMPPAVRAQIAASAKALDNRPFNADFSRNIATVTDAWARQRTLKLSYRSAGKARPKEVIVDPYFLEPSAAGYSTYLIGYSHTHDQMRTFKIERIVSAEMLPRHFEVPADLDVDGLLSSAWGIIWGEGTQVQLRFSKEVAWRVRESRWHPSQEVQELADGGVLMTISVASVMELGRWVRSWGDMVEVLAPESLREELRREAMKIARQYSARSKAVKKVAGKARRQPAAGDGLAAV